MCLLVVYKVLCVSQDNPIRAPKCHKTTPTCHQVLQDNPYVPPGVTRQPLRATRCHKTTPTCHQVSQDNPYVPPGVTRQPLCATSELLPHHLCTFGGIPILHCMTQNVVILPQSPIMPTLKLSAYKVNPTVLL